MITNPSTARWAWLGTLAIAAVGAASCNAITGADAISFENEDDDDGKSSTAQTGGSSQTGGGMIGAGGMLVATTGAGGSAATSTATTTGAGAGPTECDYPTGPYGVAQGAIVPPTLSWQGYTPGATTPSTITAQDFFDCDGSKGIDAVIIDTSQFG